MLGASGMLGAGLSESLKGDIIGLSSDELDITDVSACEAVFDSYSPSVAINAAAYTDVEGCELNPDRAFQVNALGAKNVVDCCAERDIVLIHISSVGNYGSSRTIEDGAYVETDAIHPTTVHHLSKARGEEYVLNNLKRFFIVRTGWLFGGEINHKKNFVYRIYREALSKKTIKSNSSQIGNPTSIADLVEQIQVLLATENYGLYNCVNRGRATRYEYVSAIVEGFGLSCIVKAAPKAEFKRLANVSDNESAINQRLDQLNKNVMGCWKAALKKYIEDLKTQIEHHGPDSD